MITKSEEKFRFVYIPFYPKECYENGKNRHVTPFKSTKTYLHEKTLLL